MSFLEGDETELVGVLQQIQGKFKITETRDIYFPWSNLPNGGRELVLLTNFYPKDICQISCLSVVKLSPKKWQKGNEGKYLLLGINHKPDKPQLHFFVLRDALSVEIAVLRCALGVQDVSQHLLDQQLVRFVFSNFIVLVQY